MHAVDDLVVLEPVLSEQIEISIENHYYDDTLRFLKTSGRGSNGLTFEIDAIVKQYLADRAQVMRVTLPATLYTRTVRARGAKRQDQIRTPALWEMGGLNKNAYGRPSWCAIVGDVEGGRISRHDVCQIRYPTAEHTTHPSGRHALVSVQAETMFILAQKNGNSTIALIYKIDAILDWPTKTASVPAPEDRVYVALNCSLVGIRQIKDQQTLGWVDAKRLIPDEQAGVTRLFRLAQKKLATASYTACNVELFWDAAANSTDHNRHQAPENSDVRNYAVEDASVFLAEVVHQVGEYRKLLNEIQQPTREHPIPASIQYELAEDGSVDVVVEVPSLLPNVDHFSISTRLQGTVPASLVEEPLLLNGAITFDELVDSLEPTGAAMRNIFTYC